MQEYTYKGATHSLTEWSKITGIKPRTLYARIEIYGWTMEQAMSLKPDYRNQVRRRGAKKKEAPVKAASASEEDTQPASKPAPRPLPKTPKKLSLDEVAILAKERGVSYGRFVAGWQ